MFLTEVSFPGLGLSFNVHRVAFTVLGKEIYWYGIIIAAGFLLAAFYSCRRSEQFGIKENEVLDMLLITVPVSILCARAYYCIFYWKIFRDNPISVLYIWEGGLAIYGGVIGAVICVICFTKFRKIHTLPLLDLGGLGLLIGQSIGRWGNFVNTEAYGSETACFLRMGLADASGLAAYYHPTFLYESLWNLTGFVFLHFYSKKRKFDGEIFALYVFWYGLGRSWIEGLRTDSLYLFNTGIRVSQLLAACSCIAACLFLLYHYCRMRHAHEKKLYADTRWMNAEKYDTEEKDPEQEDSERDHPADKQAEINSEHNGGTSI